jgi:hypothetical protein
MLPNVQISNLLSQEQLAALGEIAANSAELEVMAGWVLMYILKVNHAQLNVILGEVPLTKRLVMLEELGGDALEEQALKDEFKNIVDSMRKSVQDRNTVIHGSWDAKGDHLSFEDSIDIYYGNKAPQSVFAENPKNKKRRYSAEDLRVLANALYESRIQLWDFSRENWWKAWSTEVFAKQGWDSVKPKK